MALYSYEIIANNNVYRSGQTEFQFTDDCYYQGSSSLYMLHDSNQYRPYVVAGTNLLYVPGTNYGDSAYHEIQSVELIGKTAFDPLPSLAIVLLCVLLWRGIRSIFSR